MSLNTILATAPLTTTNYILKATGTTIGNSLIWDNGTNVGLSTVSPVSTNLVGSMTIVKSYNSDTPVSTTAQTYYTNQSNLYLFGRNAGLSIITNSTNEEGTIFFGNASTVAYASINTGSGTSSVGGDMYFKVGSNTERLRITSSGNVGIGTATPDFPLTIKTDASANSIKIIGRSGGDSLLAFYASNGTTAYLDFSVGAAYVNYNAVNSQNYNWYCNSSLKMVLTSGGNVLIGTATDASYKLQVQGTFRATGAITQFASTGYYVDMNYIGSTYNFGSGETTDNVDFKVAGGGTFTTGGNFRWFTQAGGSTPLERMRITSGGQVQISQAGYTFSYGLKILNWGFVEGGDAKLYVGYSGSGVGNFNNSTGVYTATSDINKKKDFEESTIGLNAVLGLKPTLYRMKTDEETSDKHLGFIAQEVKDFIPQAYSESINGEDTFIGLTEMPIIAALTKAIQEQQIQIQNLQEQINILAK